MTDRGSLHWSSGSVDGEGSDSKPLGKHHTPILGRARKCSRKANKCEMEM